MALQSAIDWKIGKGRVGASLPLINKQSATSYPEKKKQEKVALTGFGTGGRFIEFAIPQKGRTAKEESQTFDLRSSFSARIRNLIETAKPQKRRGKEMSEGDSPSGRGRGGIRVKVKELKKSTGETEEVLK